MSISKLRVCLKMIRNKETHPSTLLPNGEEASFCAHNYIIRGNKRRNKRKRKKHDRSIRDIAVQN
jgi:hypothetical protein